MGRWEFNEVDPSSVRVELTQRDQFNNDDVGIAEALVREVIQNSSDAPNGDGPVKVRFSIRTVTSAEQQQMLSHLAELSPHLQACKVETSVLDAPGMRVLSIEDFNTTGLTGKFDASDGGHFDSFWRAVGKSEKSGQSGGRWGLGKLVYSSSSMIRVFYGLTIRAGDAGPSMLGQAVLAGHVTGGKQYPAHGFYFRERAANRFQLPITDTAEIAWFTNLANVSRTSQTGLSLVIPYLIPSVTEESIVAGVVANYYFPILAGKLVVEVGDTIINRTTFLDVAATCTEEIAARIPFGFIHAISETKSSEQFTNAIKPISSSEELKDTHFNAADIEHMKSRFASGEIVHVRLPVVVKPKTDPDIVSYIELHLQALPEGRLPFYLFARGPITLRGEKNFSGAMAWGALVANDDKVSAFLGDAENPAHTAWNPHAEKLGLRWRSAAQTLASIRRSLRSLYMMVAEQAEVEDKEALLDFFSLVDKAQASAGKRKKTAKPRLNIPPREKAISIKARKGGFQIVAGPAAASWTYPRAIRVRIAYDMIGANPFTRHSKFDFDLGNGDEVTLDPTSAAIEVLKPNTLKLTVESVAFSLEADGFDVRRDLVVDARAL